MRPLFSVIVPVYNKEKYIMECIDSILNQSFNNFELILVDDGSTDSCYRICNEYSKIDNRIKVIHKENEGLVSARKKGVLFSIGEYIICVDADDYLKKDYLLNISKEIENNNPDIVCTSHCVFKKREKVKRIRFKAGHYKKKDIESRIYPFLIQSKNTKHFPVNIWAKAYKKELYFNVQMDVYDKVNIGEDGCVSIPCIYLANSLSIINDNSYVYRINDDSMTSKKTALDINYPTRVYSELIKYINTYENDFKEQLDRFVVHQLFSLIISMFNIEKPYKEIKHSIIDLLNDSFYKNAINEVKYKGNIKAHIMLLLLKKKFIYIIYLVSKVY